MAQEEALETLMDFTRVDDFRVLMALVKEVGYENQILVSQVEKGPGPNDNARD